MDERINFQAQDIELEGRLFKQSEEKGAVVTHPHPLYGGDMHNTVVESIVKAYQKKGYTTLRFNFRGVGRSRGRHDDGRGEQQDILSAISFLEGMGIQSIDLAGYSFGA